MRFLRQVLTIGLLTFAAANSLALSERDALAEFEGVWIGRDLVVDTRPAGTHVQAVRFDLAIWKTDSGFAVSWTSLNRDGIARFTGQFLTAGEPDTYKAIKIDPVPADLERIWAQIEGDRLSLYLSRIDDNGTKRVARYRCSLENGRMVFEYTLSNQGEILDRVSGTLTRAKVVM